MLRSLSHARCAMVDRLRSSFWMLQICLAEAASKITRSMMRSSLNYQQSKQVAESNSTSEREAFSEMGIKDAMERQTSRDSCMMEAILLSQPCMNVLINLILAASVTYTLPGGFSSDNDDGAHLVEGPTLQVTYLRLYVAFVYIFAVGFIASVSGAIACMLEAAAIVLANFGIMWRLRWLRMLKALESVDAVRGGLVILGTLVAAMTYEAGLRAMCRGRHLECFMLEFLCLNIMVFVWSLVILMPHLRRTVTCRGYGFSSWVLQRCTGVAMIGLSAGIAICSNRSVLSSIEFSALVVALLLCNGLEFQALLRKHLENRDYSIQETLLDYSKLDTAELQHHRDPALSDPQESVRKWLLFELPTDEDEDMKKWKTEKDKLLLVLAVLAASLTYQAGLTPPGALWQQNKADRVVGNLVLTDNHRRRYMTFFFCNATAFVSSVAIIVLLVNRKLFARGILLSNTLSVCVILDMIALTGAFAAVSSRRAATSIYVFILVFAVLVYIALQVLVRVGSGSLAEHSVLRRNRGGRSKYPLNFATLHLLLGLIGVNATGNCSESADPAVDDEDPNRPIKRSPRQVTWLVACAAAHHMTGNQSLLLTGGNMPVLDSNDGEVVLVNMADNKQAVPLRVRGSGSVRTESIDLDDVWYVPGLDSNLVSTGQLARQGCAINLGPGGCRITRGGALVGTARFTEACQFELDFLKVASSM